MLYVPYMYYENYSDSPVIKEDFWEYWESQAEREVDKKTFGRLRREPVLITEPVKQCICEIAEQQEAEKPLWLFTESLIFFTMTAKT